jgi:hypothetical protein
LLEKAGQEPIELTLELKPEIKKKYVGASFSKSIKIIPKIG